MSGDLQTVLNEVRPGFEHNVSFVSSFLVGKGLDMGCGSCPLLVPSCIHIDISPQPLCEVQLEDESFIQGDAVTFNPFYKVDFIFSSHMVEDLPTREDIVDCINKWADYLEKGGYLVLLVPDMQGGRYWTVEEGGNPSHRVNVGLPFFKSIKDSLPSLELVQIDTIPHEESCTMDVVFRKKRVAE